MKITLLKKVNSEDKVTYEEINYTVPFVSGRVFRKAIKMQKNVDDRDLDEELLDLLVVFIVEVFDKQFTVDEFYDGIDARKMFAEIQRILFVCINGENEDTEEKK